MTRLGLFMTMLAMGATGCSGDDTSASTSGESTSSTTSDGSTSSSTSSTGGSGSSSAGSTGGGSGGSTGGGSTSGSTSGSGGTTGATDSAGSGSTGGSSGGGSSGGGSSGGAIETCGDLQEAFKAETTKIRGCQNDNECGQVLTGTSCGCTRDWVARLDADTTYFYELIAMAGPLSCDLGLGSTCDCPPTDGYICDAGICNWKYI